MGLEATLEDDEEEPEEPFAEPDPPSGELVSNALLKTGSSPSSGHSIANHRSSLCTALEELKDTASGSPAAVFDRANCAESNGRPAEAVRLLQQFLQLSPTALGTDFVRSRIADLQALLALPGQNGTEVRRLYASAYGYLAERKYDRAHESFTKAVELAPGFALTYWKLALLDEAMGNVDQARLGFTRYQQLTPEQNAKDRANFDLSALASKKSKYDDEVGEAESILSDLFNRGMNLTFNLDHNRSAIRVRRAQIKKKQDRNKDKNRVGGFAIPYAYAQQQLALASGHLQIALALFPLGAEAIELMGLVFLQANDGKAATKNFDAAASEKLPVAFYAEMRGHKLDHAVQRNVQTDGNAGVQVEVQARVTNDEKQGRETASYAYEIIEELLPEAAA